MNKITIIVLLLATICCSEIIAKKINIKATKPKPQQSQCTLCEFVVNYAEDFLEQNSTEQQIIKFVESVCILFPQSFRQMCESFIEQEGESLIQLLVQKETPDVVCTQLGVCSSSSLNSLKLRETIASKIKKMQSGQYCTICEFVLQAIDGYIESNTTISEIKQLLDSFCSLLPPNFGDQCTDFVDNYLDLAIQWVVSNENPDAFCTQVGLCQNNQVKSEKIINLFKLAGAQKMKIH